jgi:hypothetical protein
MSEQSRELTADRSHARAVAEELGDQSHGAILPSVSWPAEFSWPAFSEPSKPPNPRRPPLRRLRANIHQNGRDGVASPLHLQTAVSNTTRLAYVIAGRARKKERTMAPQKIAIALVFVLITHTAATAATPLTSPFNSFQIDQGFARCLVTNGSVKRGVATVTIFTAAGKIVDSESTSVAPHATEDPTAAFTFSNTTDRPTYCECNVPSAATWRCSFAYMDQLDAPSVISAVEGR